MYQPETYGIALLFMLGSMLCWGSWANTMKLTPGFPFQLFYWDYVAGLLLGSIIWGFSLGSHGAGTPSFLQSLSQGDARHIGFAVLGGVIFNIANLLLVAAIEIAGLAVAFPVGIGLALVIGVLLNYILAPQGNPLLLFGGLIFVVLAIVVDAMAYQRRELVRKAVGKKGVQISLVAGVLMGLFYPFVAKAGSGPSSLSPYSVTFCFALGVLICAIPSNLYLMRKPLTEEHAVQMQQYVAARPSFHVWGVLGGFIWCTGAMLSFVASNAHLVGPAVSYAIGQGATLISAIWGVFVWKEFSDAPVGARRLLPLMFLFFIVGLTAIAVAPLFSR